MDAKHTKRFSLMLVLITALALSAFVLTLSTLVLAAPIVEVKGLFKGGAILVINGQQQLLKQGKTSPEGVMLVEASSKFAVIEIEGQRRKLTLSRAIGGVYIEPEKPTVRLPSGHNGHYIARGKINGASVEFMVDTGASAISMSSATADSLRLPYKKGTPTRVSTANGVASGFEMNLSSVTVGTITLNNVRAIVITGTSPYQVLLGNSFLSRIDMQVDKGVLVLQSRY